MSMAPSLPPASCLWPIACCTLPLALVLPIAYCLLLMARYVSRLSPVSGEGPQRGGRSLAADAAEDAAAIDAGAARSMTPHGSGSGPSVPRPRVWAVKWAITTKGPIDRAI